MAKKTCVTCGGTGVQIVNGKKQDCWVCGGSGEVDAG